MADNTARIAELRATLEEGVTTVVVDGTTTTVDLHQTRRELNRLVRADSTQRLQRPRLASVNISGLR